VHDDNVTEPLAQRELHSLTADLEKRLLVFIAKRLPGWVTPDRLTALGAAGMIGAGLCYRLVPLTPLALLGVNLCLFINWFGDSLDGTLARVRNRQRPRYGFYVDHVVDAFGALALLAGLQASGLLRPALAWALLIAYLLLQIHVALKAHALGVFQIAFGGIGGTELRIVVGALNMLVLWRGTRPAPGAPSAFDVATVLALAGLALTIAVDAARTTRELWRRERLT
jgi:archaetidylinositol phosphate synthase